MRQLSLDDLSSEFDKNYAYYRQWIERGLVKQVYDRGRFDDLCQDTFVKALTSFARQDAKLPQTDDHLGKLLSVMAVQVAIDDYRKNKSKEYLLLSDSEATRLTELMVEGDDDRICNCDRLQKVLAQLPPEQQKVLWLLLQGLKQKDIAVELHFSEATVSEYLKRAKAEVCSKIYPETVDIRHMEETRLQREFNRINRTYLTALRSVNEEEAEEEFLRRSKFLTWCELKMLQILLEMSKIVTVEISEADIDLIVSERAMWSRIFSKEFSMTDKYVLRQVRMTKIFHKLLDNYNKEVRALEST